jgi:hypothetical protein
VAKRHFVANITGKKILDVGYWWPTLFKDWHTPKLFDRFKCESESENSGRIRSWGTLPSLQRFGGRRACWSSGMAIRTNKKWVNYFTRTCINQTTSWLVRSWSIFGAQTSHGQPHIPKLTTTRIWGKPPPSL